MALTITGTNTVSHGSSSVWENLGDQTWLAWFWLNSWATDHLVSSLFGGTDIVSMDLGPTGQMGIYYSRNNQNWNNRLRAVSSETWATGKWWFVACAIDPGGVAGDQEIYRGDLTTSAAELTYIEQLLGSGTHDDSGGTLHVGDVSFYYVDKKQACLMIYDSKLTLAQIQAQQYEIYRPLFSGCRLFCNYGWNGTSTQPDWSGNLNNGTVTGATVVDHVPLGFFSPPKANDFGPDSNIALDSGADNPANWLQGVKISY